MTLRKLNTLFILITAGLVIASLWIHVSSMGLNSLSQQTFVLVFPFFLSVMTKRTQRYPKVGLITSFVAVLLALAGLQMSLQSQLTPGQ